MRLSSEVEVQKPPPILDIRDLTVDFPTSSGVVTPVAGVHLGLRRGQALGIVGESGSGKSVTLRAIMGLLPPPGAVRQGEVLLEGRQILGLKSPSLRKIRGDRISMIFQDPTASFNPVISVGAHLSEVLRVKRGMGRREARAMAVDLLDRVGIVNARQRLKAYPHELSGGMAQRVMIAMAIATDPLVLLADEPTTALDVTVQDQVLRLLNALRQSSDMAMIIVSHDIGVIAQTCDDVAVMYAGRILERGSVEDVLRHPLHPYTRALVESVPRLSPNPMRVPLATIPGQLPDLRTVAIGCPFRTRCPHARDECAELAMPAMADSEHASACPFVDAGAL